MIALFDSSEQLRKCEKESGVKAGQLLTPQSWRRNRAWEEGRPWGVDNGAFGGFYRHREAWVRMLKKEQGRDGCLFVAIPDVVGSASRTLDLFWDWAPEVKDMGYPLAFVAQDGAEDINIPWGEIAAVFIGGSDYFKQSQAAKDVAIAARSLREPRWVHVGRINTNDRLEAWWDYADSFDGSGIAQYTHMRRALLGDRRQGRMFS